MFSRGHCNNTAIATHIMVVLIHSTSLAEFMNKIPEQAFIAGGPGIMHCSALGNPTPQFKWSRQDGRSLQDGRFIQLANGSLMMKSVQAEDKGTYICTIKQPRGFESRREKSQSVNVMVMGKMKKKYQLRRVNSSIGGLQPISRDTDNNAALYNCWWTSKRS